MDFIYIFVCFSVFALIEYFTIPIYIRINKDLFWSLYHKDIIKAFKKKGVNLNE